MRLDSGRNSDEIFFREHCMRSPRAFAVGPENNEVLNGQVPDGRTDLDNASCTIGAWNCPLLAILARDGALGLDRVLSVNNEKVQWVDGGCEELNDDLFRPISGYGLRDELDPVDWVGGAIGEDEGFGHCDVKTRIRVGMTEAKGLDDR